MQAPIGQDLDSDAESKSCLRVIAKAINAFRAAHKTNDYLRF